MNTDISRKNSVVVLGVSDCDEKMCAAGGRISTQQGSAMDIWAKSQDAAKNASLISKVTRSGHNSTVEHVFFNLAFNDVSVVVEQFMIEFRLASFTVKSRRYVDFGDVGYYVPVFESGNSGDEYCKVIDSLFEDYRVLVEKGVPKEDARFVLPYCFYSNFFCSMNGREMLRVLHAMLHGRGKNYPELSALGKQLYEQVLKLTPGLLADFDARAPKGEDCTDLSFLPPAQGDTLPAQRPAELVSFTHEPEQAVARAALLEAGAFTQREIDLLTSDDETRGKIISAVLASSRPRALECAQFTFRLNNVSLACLTHLVRHRIHTPLIPSLTLVDREKYIIPDSVNNSPELLDIYCGAFSKNASLYSKLLEAGESAQTLIYLLLAGNVLDISSTMNARELFLFIKLRSCTRAQWEIQVFAKDMLSQLRLAAPMIFNRYGPSCFSEGKCPEGAFSCGRSAEMQELFS